MKKRVLKIYNLLPDGAKKRASEEFGCAHWYFRNQLEKRGETDKYFYNKALDAISKASNDTLNQISATNFEIQANVLKLKQELK